MRKLMIAAFVSIFALSAMACDGSAKSGKGKTKTPAQPTERM